MQEYMSLCRVAESVPYLSYLNSNVKSKNMFT